jgi:N-acetylmuramoyl-L-alanine amidase
MSCPAVAVEIAPEMGPDKKAAAGLDDPGYQARVAEALAAALVEWRSEAHQP